MHLGTTMSNSSWTYKKVNEIWLYYHKYSFKLFHFYDFVECFYIKRKKKRKERPVEARTAQTVEYLWIAAYPRPLWTLNIINSASLAVRKQKTNKTIALVNFIWATHTPIHTMNFSDGFCEKVMIPRNDL